jgi:hypothetical protein
MAPTPNPLDETSGTPLIHPDAIAIAHALEPLWDELRAGIPAWHPRNDGDESGGEGGNGDDGQGDTDSGGGQGGGAGDETLPDSVKAILRKERKARADAEKAARDAQARIQQFEDQGKSDLEKATEKAGTLEQRATKAEARIARWEAARDAGLPLELADRLQGDTPEQLAEDAERLKGLVKPAGNTGDGGSESGSETGQGKGGSFDGGSRGSGQPKLTREQIARMSPEQINARWADVQEALSTN